MLCREQVAQLRGVTPDIRERGADLTVIGNGSPAQADEFQRERSLPFTVLVDPDMTAYRAAGLRRGVATSLSVRTIKSAARAWRGGHRQSQTQGDPWQQGGALVIAPGDCVLLHQVSEVAGDHVEPASLLATLERARSKAWLTISLAD